MLMAASKELLTVEVARAWLQATEAERAQEEARTRARIIDRVLADLVHRVQWGLNTQDAADDVWRIWRRRHEPAGVKELVAETLEGVGWVRASRKAGGAS